MYKKFFKRFLDIILSFLAIIAFSPILLILSILVLIFMGWPIIFKQERPGKDEKIFNMYKFRTMTNKKDKEGNLLPDKDRLTKFGKFLRKTSLDELPELFCILTGKMSFVGPRPLLVRYLPYYTKEEHHRHDVRPGLTGLAQVSGRNLLNWDERFKTDLDYVNNITFIGDVQIVLKTVKKVLKGSDIVVCSNCNIKSLDKEREEKNSIILVSKTNFKKYEDDLLSCLLYLNNYDNKLSKNILREMQKFLNDGTAKIYGYIYNKKVVGFIWGYNISKDDIHVNYFVVKPNFQKKGIGSLLLKKMMNNNCNIELLVRKNNVNAIKFYQNHNFILNNYDAEKYKMTLRLKEL